VLGESKTEQFVIRTRVNGKLIRDQRIHDPFLHNRTVVGISRWDLFKAIFCRQYEVKVEVSVEGSPAIERAIMMLDPVLLEKENESIIKERTVSRENCLSCGDSMSGGDGG
jgi:hypothetical protein